MGELKRKMERRLKPYRSLEVAIRYARRRSKNKEDIEHSSYRQLYIWLSDLFVMRKITEPLVRELRTELDQVQRELDKFRKAKKNLPPFGSLEEALNHARSVEDNDDRTYRQMIEWLYELKELRMVTKGLKKKIRVVTLEKETVEKKVNALEGKIRYMRRDLYGNPYWDLK